MRADVPDLIAAASAMCLTSEAEALPMSILEAMALGRPVVATDVGGTREAVIDGETGFVVAAGDERAVTRALLDLAADPTAPARWARRAGGASASTSTATAWSTLTGAPSKDRREMSSGIDVLVVSLGTTLGWRLADEVFLGQLERAGVSTAVVSMRFGAAGKFRRGYPLNDFVEMHAARRATIAAVRERRPRAVVLSSTTAAMLSPRLDVPYAVRLDAPAAMNRPGRSARRCGCSSAAGSAGRG